MKVNTAILPISVYFVVAFGGGAGRWWGGTNQVLKGRKGMKKGGQIDCESSSTTFDGGNERNLKTLASALVQDREGSIRG